MNPTRCPFPGFRSGTGNEALEFVIRTIILFLANLIPKKQGVNIPAQKMERQSCAILFSAGPICPPPLPGGEPPGRENHRSQPEESGTAAICAPHHQGMIDFM
jgi:hypothetical protein